MSLEASTPVAIDCHAHVFRRGLPLAAARRYTPDYDALPERYLDHLDAHGLTHGVLVQPSFLGTDNSFLLDALCLASHRLRGIAVLEPDVSPETIERLAQAGIVGIRLNLLGRRVVEPAGLLGKHLLKAIEQHGWQIEIQAAARDLARLLPDLLGIGARLVLDHFALPDRRLGVEDPGFQTVLTLSAGRPVWVKLSAPYRLGEDGGRIAAAAYPRLREVLGLERLLWGSDWPHTQFERRETYADAIACLATLVPDAAERHAILQNPAKLFGFR